MQLFLDNKIKLPIIKWQRGKVIYLLLNIKQSAALGPGFVLRIRWRSDQSQKGEQIFTFQKSFFYNILIQLINYGILGKKEIEVKK